MSELFNIQLETDLSEFDSTVTDGGDLSQEAGAALGGTSGGLQCVIDDTTAIYGLKTQLAPASNEIRYRCYVDPNGLTMSNGDRFAWCNIETSTGGILNLILLQIDYVTGTGYRLAVRSKNDAGANTDNYVNLTDAPHYVEVYMLRAATNVSADGSYQVWVDGALQITET